MDFIQLCAEVQINALANELCILFTIYFVWKLKQVKKVIDKEVEVRHSLLEARAVKQRWWNTFQIQVLLPQIKKKIKDQERSRIPPFENSRYPF